jgi:hypothetical protein
MTTRTEMHPSPVERATAAAIRAFSAALSHHHSQARVFEDQSIPETEFRRIVAGYLCRMTYAEMLELLGVAPTDLDRRQGA